MNPTNRLKVTLKRITLTCRPWYFALLLALLSWTLTGPGLMQGTLLWRLGYADNSAAEFSSYKTANPEIVNISGTPAAAISKGLKADLNPAMQLNYSLGSVPSYGAMLSFKLLHAHRLTPEMTVFSNGICVGIIQLWGTGGTNQEHTLKWRKTYQLYIPKEFLKAGANVLRLEATRNSYAGASLDQYLWWEWDYLQLEALTAPATEPVHGKAFYLGTTLSYSGICFTYDQPTVNAAAIIFKWLGIAYSNNTIRATFWSNVTHQQPNRLEYLQALRDLNMTVVADHLNVRTESYFNGDALSAAGASALDNFFLNYRNYFQWYELDNEPGIYCSSKERIKSIAHHVNSIRMHVKTTAPGWAYASYCGTPTGWEADPGQRAEVEAMSQTGNGHTYGIPSATDSGFVENLKSAGPITDGWPKEMIATETGTQEYHFDDNLASSNQPHASAFDRILRANVAVVDRAMHHAVKFRTSFPEDYSLFTGSEGWTDAINQLTAHPGANNGLQDSRLKTFRRLALAYATHGQPLTYTYLNPAQVQNQKVYFRAVDTATLPPVAGSGATSDKILLNFVNFSGQPQTMQVRVTMPSAGAYSAQRIGPGDSYSASHSHRFLTATPTVDLTEVLGPREAVQYIVTRPAPRILAVYAPPVVHEGATGVYGIMLSEPPAGNVSVSVTRVSGDTDITVRGPSVFTFTPSNWNVSQAVTLAAADDADTNNGAALIRASAPGYIAADVNAAEVENDTLPCAWGSSNIGATTSNGSGVFALDTFVVKGAGADIGGTADQFQFAWLQLNGNATITARVAAVDYTTAGAKAGVMIREGLDSGARHALMAITAGTGAVFQLRLSPGGSTTSTTVAGVAAPHWVRLTRIGNLFLAARSADGVSWTRVGAATMTNPANTIYVGLAMTSQLNGTLGTGYFEQVSISHSFPGTAANNFFGSMTTDTLGAYNQSSHTAALSAMSFGGPPDLTIDYGQSGDLPIAGDWNGDDIDSLGVFRNGTFALRNSNTSGAPELTFSFGQQGDIPIAGDWDGDGVDTIGVYRNGTFYLRNANASGAAHLTFTFGQAGDLPVIGDWDGNGVDTIGVFRNGTFYLRNANSAGAAHLTFNFGQAGDLPVGGDWNDDGIDTIGVYRGGIFYLRFQNAAGPENVLMYLGSSGDRPLAGHWLDKSWVYNSGLPPSCAYSILPVSQTFAASSGTGTVNVTANPDCTWTATSNAPWITITAGNSGSGTGTVSYSVAAHPNSTPRTGTIAITTPTTTMQFTVRQGAQFNDVPATHPFFAAISKLSAYGITSGCGDGNYCPDQHVTREQMAIFIERSLGIFTPPSGPTTPTFADVPNSGATDFSFEFIEDLAVRGITQGCAMGPPRLYCPTANVTREQMAIFIMRALGVLTPPTPPTPTFADVPNNGATDFSYEFIEEFYARGITAGCAAGPPRRYCPFDPVTRGQMAVFLVRAFNL